MAITRVHELAREFGVESRVVLDFLKARGEFVKSASSTIDHRVAVLFRDEFGATLAGSSWASDEEESNAPRLPSMLDLETALAGSPYSLPQEQRAYIEDVYLPMAASLIARASEAQRRISEVGLRTLRRVNRTSEIYESNRIEGLGPDLATTDRLLDDHSLSRDIGVTVARHAIQQCLDAEPKVREVIGLGAARVLAEVYCGESDRALTETDIRQLHGLIMVGDRRGGAYKQYVNAIAGSTHVPPSPTDTPAQMRELTDWLATTGLSPVWRAAVAHAWLTHIHPFHDGNGRVARLLANIILIRETLPPLIVSASGDKGAYLDALASSDEGGNILPLARVFRRVVGRAVKDLEDPDFAWRLFQAEVERRYEPLYDRWVAALNNLMSETAAQLLLRRLHMEKIGAIGNAEFTRFRKGWHGNVWLAKVHLAGKTQDLLLHVAQPSSASARHLERDERFPSLFLSVRNQRPLDAKQYLPVGHLSFDYEFTPIADTDLVLVRSRGDARRLRTSDAARLIAAHLDRVARQLIVH